MARFDLSDQEWKIVGKPPVTLSITHNSRCWPK